MTVPTPPDPHKIGWLTAYAETTIAAPRETVWNILTDFAAYNEWNPFTYDFEVSTFAVGEPVGFQVRMKPDWIRYQGEIFAHVQAPELLAWRIQNPNIFLKAVRYQYLTDTAEGHTRYQTWEYFSGILAPLLGVMVLKHVRLGFADVAAALKERAESIAQGA